MGQPFITGYGLYNMLSKLFCAVLAAVNVALTLSEIAILSGPQTIYDQSPKIKIKATGFDDYDDHDINLDIGAKSSTLRVNKDFLVTKSEDGLILKLLSNRR